MDISKNYIKMCENSPEIQKHKIANGDYFYRRSKVEISGTFERTLTGPKDSEGMPTWSYNPVRGGNSGDVWLPRQDQLQEMVKASTPSWEELAQDFGDWAHERHDANLQLGSMEQLWLAFVMKEIYNKDWNGEDWVEYETVKKSQ